MAKDDIEEYGPAPTNTIRAILAAGSVVVEDNVTITSVGVGQVYVIVVKAA